VTELFRFCHVYYGYIPQQSVLYDLNCRVNSGERIGLIGHNGSGKTTFLQLFVGLLRPQQGEIYAFGQQCCIEKDFWNVRLKTGFLFQDPDDQLFCPTVAEDVAFGVFNQGKSHAEVAKIVQETLTQLGLEAYAERITHKLSFGEKRLVALATILAMQPDILLLDEPTVGLDEIVYERIVQILQNLPQALLIVSHDKVFLQRLNTKLWRLEAGHLITQNDTVCFAPTGEDL
jgi:cobalt/nickel transport system ATP-binding protein